jgi:HEPN domain-containing protein
MDDAKRELVKNWLVKAQRDLASARRLSTGDEPYLDTAIYHCQQSAEKAAKAFLTYHDQRFEKVHDIRLLISLAIPIEDSFSAWLNAGERLTPYAAAFRYPSENLEPGQEEFEQALEAAHGLYKFVISLLPEETHP